MEGARATDPKGNGYSATNVCGSNSRCVSRISKSRQQQRRRRQRRASARWFWWRAEPGGGDVAEGDRFQSFKCGLKSRAGQAAGIQKGKAGKSGKSPGGPSKRSEFAAGIDPDGFRAFVIGARAKQER